MFFKVKTKVLLLYIHFPTRAWLQYPTESLIGCTVYDTWSLGGGETFCYCNIYYQFFFCVFFFSPLYMRKYSFYCTVGKGFSICHTFACKLTVNLAHGSNVTTGMYFLALFFPCLFLFIRVYSCLFMFIHVYYVPCYIFTVEHSIDVFPLSGFSYFLQIHCTRQTMQSFRYFIYNIQYQLCTFNITSKWIWKFSSASC